jgi:hypothetical protein
MQCPGCGVVVQVTTSAQPKADPKRLEETIARYRAFNDEVEATHRTRALERRLRGDGS